MSEEFEEITAPATKAKPAPKEGPLKLKDVQQHPELMGPQAAALPAKPDSAPAPLPADAPWYQCWNVEEAHANDGGMFSVETGAGREVRQAELHPPFQSAANTRGGEYPECPICQRRTVMPLEHYSPAHA